MQMKINLKAPINKFWKDYLQKYTGPADVGEVSNKTSVGFYTLKRLRLGETNVANEENKKAIEALVLIAIKNATKKRVNTENDESEMLENLENIFEKEDKQAIIDVI